MFRKVAAALVAALALGVASCGGGEETLTRAELVRKIEVACREGQKQAEATARARRGAREAASGLIAAVLANQQSVEKSIEDLDPPDAAKDDFDAFKQGVQERVDTLRSISTSDNARDAIQRVQSTFEAITRRVQQAARSLQIDGCV